MATECFSGDVVSCDVRADIYRLGMFMYHLITGIDPCSASYTALPITQVMPKLPPLLSNIVTKCIQQNPADRFGSFGEILNALENGTAPAAAPDTNATPKKGMFNKIFGSSAKTNAPTNIVGSIIADMDRSYISKTFYGGADSASQILTKISTEVFGNMLEASVRTSLQVYLQTWHMLRATDNIQKSLPRNIISVLCERFTSVNPALITKCVVLSVNEIFAREPELKARIDAIEAMNLRS